MDVEFSLSALVYPELKTTHRLNYGSNFRSWNEKLKFVLFDNKVDYVLSQPKPSENDDVWVKDDFIARHIIRGAVHDYVYMSYEKYDTAKALLDALTATFNKPSMTGRMTKLRRYVGHKMAEGKSVNEHIMEMASLACDLDCEGLKIPEEVQAVMLMNSVPESWDRDLFPVRLDMDMDKSGDPVMGLNNVERSLRAIGSEKAMFARREEEAAAASGKRRRHFKGNCFSCGQYGHHARDCIKEEEDSD